MIFFKVGKNLEAILEEEYEAYLASWEERRREMFPAGLAEVGRIDNDALLTILLSQLGWENVRRENGDVKADDPLTGWSVNFNRKGGEQA